MKAFLLIFSLFAFTSSFTTAQRANPYLDCKREPNPSFHHLKQDLRQAQTALSENRVAVFYVLANDEEYSEVEFQAIRKATREIQAWYQINTGGVTYAFADPDTVSFYRAEHNTSYYRENWWGLLLPEMEMAGLPI